MQSPDAAFVAAELVHAALARLARRHPVIAELRVRAPAEQRRLRRAAADEWSGELDALEEQIVTTVLPFEIEHRREVEPWKRSPTGKKRATSGRRGPERS